MATNTSTQNASLALPLDTPPRPLPTPKPQTTSLMVVGPPIPTPQCGSSPGALTPGTVPSPKARSPVSNIAIWANGQSPTPLVTPTKPTETTSSGRSAWSAAIGATQFASPISM